MADMIRMLRPIALLLSVILLAGCVLPSPGGSKGPAEDGALLPADAIEVTTLDAATEPAIAPEGEAALPPEPMPPTEAPSLPEAASAPPPARPAAPATEPATAPPAEASGEPPVPLEVLSPEGQTCIDQGGMWVSVGEGASKSCVSPTRDSDKRCDQGSDCEGECLARSGTCAPFMPLFGCNDVLDDDGRQMTLCLD